MITATPKDQRLTRHEAAGLLGCHPVSLDRYCVHGYRGIRLPRHRVGGRVYLLAAEIDQWQREVDRLHGEAPANEPTIEARAERADQLCESLGV